MDNSEQIIINKSRYDRVLEIEKAFEAGSIIVESSQPYGMLGPRGIKIYGEFPKEITDRFQKEKQEVRQHYHNQLLIVESKLEEIKAKWWYKLFA